MKSYVTGAQNYSLHQKININKYKYFGLDCKLK